MLETFYSRMDYLKKGMDGLWARNSVIADNIANVDTPGYKAKNINFEEVFSEYLSNKEKEKQLKEKYDIDADAVLRSSRFSIYEKEGLNTKANGNNVDMDREMAALSENTMRYNLLTEEINFQLRIMKDVISEGK